MVILRKIATLSLVVLSFFMALSGLSGYVITSGRVFGTEFQMLINLVNLLSLIMMWAANVTIWYVLKCATAGRT